MSMHAIAFSVALSFFFLILVFRPLEMAFSAKKGQRFLRPAFWTDVCFFLGQYLLWSGAVLWILSRFGDWIDGIMPAAFRAGVAGQPWWLQAVEVVLLSDLFCLLGASAAASCAALVAVSFNSSQRGAPGLAGSASRASGGHGVHDGADQPARVYFGISAGDIGGADCVPGHLGDLYSLQRAIADGTVAGVNWRAGTASLAS
jgi:hypothetical protein